YVPLDPGEPIERLRFFLQDCRASIVVTGSRFLDLVAGSGARALALDPDAPWIDAPGDAGAPASPVRPESLAYVIYTSGSTGAPKGVGVEHRQLAAYVDAAIDRLGIEPGWSFALVSTLAADLGNTSLFPALVTG